MSPLAQTRPCGVRGKYPDHQRRNDWVGREDASNWAKKQLARTRNRKYRPDEKKPDQTVAKSKKRLASRFYQMKTGHCLTGQWARREEDESLGRE